MYKIDKNKMKEARNNRNMNCTQLAELSGFSSSHIWEIENRRTSAVPLSTINAIAYVLGINNTDLIDNPVSEEEKADLFTLFELLNEKDREHILNLMGNMTSKLRK